MGIGSFFNSLIEGIPVIGPVVKGVESVFGGDDSGDGGNGSSVLNGLSQVLGGAGSGQAAQQAQQGNLATQQGNLQQKMYEDAMTRFLTQRVGLPTQGASMARSGDLQANVQDVLPTMTPGAGYSFSGGLRPSALGPNARLAGQNLSNAGLGLQNAGSQLPPLPNFPNIQTQPGGLQQALQYGALGTGVLGAIGAKPDPLRQWLTQQLQGGGGGGGGQQTYGPQDPDPYGLNGG